MYKEEEPKKTDTVKHIEDKEDEAGQVVPVDDADK